MPRSRSSDATANVAPDAAVEPQDVVVRLAGCALEREEAVILTDLDLEVRGGEVVALVGPNGAGKTSLLRLLAGELQPTAGTLTRRSGAQRIAFMGDDPFLYDVLTPAEHLAFVAKFMDHEVDVPRLLREFGLWERRSTYARNLSLGERQRLTLALTEAAEPELVLMDEPFNGLDVAGTRTVARHVRRLASLDRAVVIVAHHLADLDGLVDRVVALDRGRLVADTTLGEGRRIGDEVAPHVVMRS